MTPGNDTQKEPTSDELKQEVLRLRAIVAVVEEQRNEALTQNISLRVAVKQLNEAGGQLQKQAKDMDAEIGRLRGMVKAASGAPSDIKTIEATATEAPAAATNGAADAVH